MNKNNISLDCSSKPLSSYLKALGILRLVSSPSNNLTGIAADSQIRGWWVNQKFHLNTILDVEELIHFFLYDYTPSAIIAPWNNGSGFYPKDNQSAFNSLLSPNAAPRFKPLASAIELVIRELEYRGLREAPQKEDKRELIAALRNNLQDFMLDWLDASLLITGDTLSFPQLLGTGGNDGNMEFSRNFHQRLVSNDKSNGLFDVNSGQPTNDAIRLIRNSLFDESTHGFHSVAIGQFDPGAVGGPNATSEKYEADTKVNPWDFVLSLEGAIMFAGAATRRHQASKNPGASFPFTVQMTGAGSGSVSTSDENNARAEFWAPIWGQPSNYDEIRVLLKEGRAVLHGKVASNGLEFARAAASLGINRGIDNFERYAFVMRSGKAYLATPIGTQRVSSPEANAARLINDLDAGNWISNVRRVAYGKNSPARAQVAFHRLENALFAMTEATALSPHLIQLALEALGNLVGWIQYSKEVTDSISPPPRLSSAWQSISDDNSAEFRIACALANLGWPTVKAKEQSVNEQVLIDEKSIPMAAHVAPVELNSVTRKFRSWDTQSSKFLNVWHGQNLESILIGVLERRLIEQKVNNQTDKPLWGNTEVRLSDIEAFFNSNFNDARCIRLLAGLVWASPGRFKNPQNSDPQRPVIPTSYAILKMLFTPNHIMKFFEKEKLVPPECPTIPIPSGLITRLRSEQVNEAVQIALNRLNASGIPTPFSSSDLKHVGVTGKRLAASVLIPINKFGSKSLFRKFRDETEEN